MSRGPAEMDALIAKARALPIEDGLLGQTIAWKNGSRGVERSGPCPCGLATHDGFVIHTGKKVFICRPSGTGGDVIALAMHVAGVGFLEAVELLVGERSESAGNRATLVPSEKERAFCREAERGSASARRIANAIRPIVGTRAERYLAEVRRIDVTAIHDVLERSDAIGWHDSVYFHEPGEPGRRPAHELHGQRLGCIVGVMSDPVTCTPTGAISRTYIDGNLSKVGKAKTLAAPQGVVRLSRDEEVHEGLFLAEGIETALAGMAIGLRPMWATGCTAILKRLPLLSGIGSITIVADHDPKGQGEAAAREMALRWGEAGREVRIFRRSVLGDLNDAMRARAA